ncbi:hypothetical protein B9Z55_019026 [Caenorhabditis nigoni]|uniref:Uncharacterized protein n=1 Tax=Caenorhabditis nigoni TaxID=1611254 RepID=A0A2G5TGR1_9PELO|nr:hypothetical protein B9Z55_019026 [Caenorhabditis nigoni]
MLPSSSFSRHLVAQRTSSHVDSELPRYDPVMQQNEFDESRLHSWESTLERSSSSSSRHLVAQQSPSSHLRHSLNPE